MDLALDLLDQLLFDLRQEGCVFGRVEASEPWRIEKAKCSVAPFYAILTGTARVETATIIHDLSAGDFICLLCISPPPTRDQEPRALGAANAGAFYCCKITGRE